MNDDHELFILHEIIRRSKSNVTTYYCAERVNDGLFSVLQLSIFRPPFLEKDAEMARVNLKEVLLDLEVDQYPWEPSLIAAINRHDMDFGN